MGGEDKDEDDNEGDDYGTMSKQVHLKLVGAVNNNADNERLYCRVGRLVFHQMHCVAEKEPEEKKNQGRFLDEHLWSRTLVLLLTILPGLAAQPRSFD